MAEVFSRCIKCKGSLYAANSSSKLLPCLHTLCDDCISGRTDVAEKLKASKEELKEETQAEKASEAENDHEVKQTDADQPCNSSTASTADESSFEQRNTTDAKLLEEQKHQDDSCKSHQETSVEEEVPRSVDTTEHAEVPCHDISGCDRKADNTEYNGGKEAEVGITEETEKTQPDQDDISMKGEGVIAPKPTPLTECPECNEAFKLDNLIDNIFVHKNTKVTEDTGKDKTCTGCEICLASTYCLQCQDWLCEDCVAAHKRVRMTKDHQLVPPEEAVTTKGSGSPGEMSMVCPQHPTENITLFCENCKVVTCRDCQLLHHKEHKYVFIKEAADSYREMMGSSMSQMKERRNNLHKNLMQIEERLNDLKRQRLSLKKDILEQGDLVVKGVKAKVWSILSSLHAFSEATSKWLSQEMKDVEDMMGRFDHCIDFMEAILDNGFGIPILFTKALLEKHCRKVYHSQIEPQSLKGELTLKYQHDVPSFLRRMSDVGAIYVNGSRFPPEKSNSQSSNSGTEAQNRLASHPDSAVGGASLHQSQNPQQIPTNKPPSMLNQQRRPSASLLNPTLAVPSWQQGGNATGGVSVKQWPSQQVGLVHSNNGLVPRLTAQNVIRSQLHQNQLQLMNTRRSSSSPVLQRAGSGMPNRTPVMIDGGQGTSLGLRRILPAPPVHPATPVQAQAQGATASAQHSGHGQPVMALLSTGQPVSLVFPFPDPAQSVAGGPPAQCETQPCERTVPSIRIKSEPINNQDCIITSVTGHRQTSSVPVLSSRDPQKSLEEVIRGVPLNVGDSLEAIRGPECVPFSPEVPTTVSSPAVGSTASVSVSAEKVISSARTDRESLAPTVTCSPTTTATTTVISTTANITTTGREKRVQRQQGNKQKQDMITGSQQKGACGTDNGAQVRDQVIDSYLASGGSLDPNDDYCAACHQGGDVLCCDKCPRVFHLQCHVPPMASVPNGAFVCTLCEEGLVMDGTEVGAAGASGKRKAPIGLSDRARRVCERVLLELFCHPSSLPFHEPVNRAVPHYYKIITCPMDFTNIKCKLSRSHFNYYATVQSFLDDCKLVFKNCAVYNAETSEVGRAGKIVSAFFENLVSKHMPGLKDYVHLKDNQEITAGPELKRSKMASSSELASDSGKKEST